MLEILSQYKNGTDVRNIGVHIRMTQEDDAICNSSYTKGLIFVSVQGGGRKQSLPSRNVRLDGQQRGNGANSGF